jgi:hypothetical protein
VIELPYERKWFKPILEEEKVRFTEPKKDVPDTALPTEAERPTVQISVKVSKIFEIQVQRIQEATGRPRAEVVRELLERGLTARNSKELQSQPSKDSIAGRPKGEIIAENYMRKILFSGVDLKRGRSVQTRGWSS